MYWKALTVPSPSSGRCSWTGKKAAAVTLLQMYDKSDRENISDNELKNLLKKNGL